MHIPSLLWTLFIEVGEKNRIDFGYFLNIVNTCYIVSPIHHRLYDSFPVVDRFENLEKNITTVHGMNENDCMKLSVLRYWKLSALHVLFGYTDVC